MQQRQRHNCRLSGSGMAVKRDGGTDRCRQNQSRFQLPQAVAQVLGGVAPDIERAAISPRHESNRPSLTLRQPG